MPNRNLMLSKVEEGMKVYDNEGSEVGKVELVHFAEASEMSGAGAATAPSRPAESGLMDILSKVFGSDDLPEELRERLLMHGFIKMDSARLFGADRYIMTDQISSVEEDGVHLKVADSEALLKG